VKKTIQQKVLGKYDTVRLKIFETVRYQHKNITHLSGSVIHNTNLSTILYMYLST